MHVLRSRYGCALVSCFFAAAAFGQTNGTPHVQLEEASIAQLTQQLRRGELTSHTLVQQYLDRIAALDKAGPAINAVIELNPDALAIADKVDAARKSGKVYGPLHGIPVLIKDNIDTAGKMSTSAGSLALADSIAAKDATVVARLRAAGAVILGKTNLSEWANFRSTHSTSGLSGLGGLTRNPYALDRNTCGSSSGTGAAIAANFAVVGVGTETDGSIVCPSSVNGLVGIKPTLGLVSRAGIVPIAHSQDTAGPMARTVADAATLLTVLAGSDVRDAATKDADKHRRDYTKALDAKSLKGARIGIVRKLAGVGPEVDRVFDASIVALKAAGAVIVDPVELPNQGKYDDDESVVLQYEFKADLDAYLAALAPNVKTRSLADLIEFNKAHADREMPWFGQELLEQSQARGGLDEKVYKDALAKSKRLAGAEGIDAALAKDKLDALIAPTGGPAWVTDLVNGDHYTGGSSTPAAVAGYPAVTVPMSAVHGLPVGVTFFAGAWSEAQLIGYAYAFEQATHARKPPQFSAHIDTPN
ncbi:MAG: amidase [Rudaea sp.]|nr:MULTISPECIES: amidase [unclassified Rudaea]MBN8884513.1 amidase [Rudaea sp.]